MAYYEKAKKLRSRDSRAVDALIEAGANMDIKCGKVKLRKLLLEVRRVWFKASC